MNKPIVINLNGGPGSGKSTGAAYIFSKLKMMGYNCELVAEFAKDKTWEHNQRALSCQEYVFGKQSYRLARCRDEVDIIVTDSPLPLSIIYNRNGALDDNFTNSVLNVFNTYENFNVYLNRVKPYNPKGRNQTPEESDNIGKYILRLYDIFDINLLEFDGDSDGYEKILDVFLETYKEQLKGLKVK